MPIVEGLIPYTALKDGSTELYDWYVLNEILAVKSENKERANDAANKK